MSTTVEMSRNGAIARILFRSPGGVQILSTPVRNALTRILDELAAAPDCRVVMFAATGRTFLAGADLNELRALTAKTARKFARDGQRLFQQIAALPPVTLAAIHAPCAGGGCELALACDLRIAAASARIGLPEVTLGLIPGWGGTVRTTLLLGAARARQIILSGELYPADAALRLGLIDETAPDAEFEAAVNARAARFLKANPAAIARAKQFIARIEPARLKTLLRAEAAEFAACYTCQDPAEGLAAFLEKRAAHWAV